ncbi:protein LONGIFOLIA 1-like [Vicia villosa]|uniref:protein LONGIFOLIA 1-like n=1 Tax=Vicia villosa TaxID=3911 RepID=UPI00273B287C|nr:protein LONGIFOLIA 1-like [Vicia villosa]
MSVNGSKSMKDEKNDLQKQIGCITGFFQLFDRHRFITGHRTSSYIPNSSTSDAKNQKIAKEKPHFSTESSITSVSSSSRSSSMSSIDFNKIIKIESSSNKQNQIPKKSHSRHQSLDFYDVVKDSMHREAKSLYVKTLIKEEKKVEAYALKNQHIDSPRPMLSMKSSDGGVKVSKEPLHNLSRSRKPHWDSPRLSYDAVKSATVHKEVPRFSLDSKQGSVRRINEGNKARNVYERNSTSQLQELETPRRSSSVVAKLMGLEALPDSTQTCRTSICSTDQIDLTARASTNDEYKKHQSSPSPRNRRDDVSIKNVKQHSRFALESTTSPRQPDANQSSDTKASKSSLSVYGQIEKRLAELEFKKSGKDLRALKQILEAMQRFSDSSSDTKNNNTSLDESSKAKSPRIQQKDSEFVTVESSSNSTRDRKSPIVIMKPTKVTRKANNTPSTEFSIHQRLVDKQKAKGIVSTEKPSKTSQDRNGRNTISFGNITVTGSPRLQKKFGFETRSPPASPSSDSTINRRQHNRQLVDLPSSSCSPHRHDFSVLQDRDEHFSDTSSLRKFKHHVNVISSDFDSNRSLDTLEIVRIDQSANINQNDEFEYSRNEHSKADKIVTPEQPSPVSVLDAAFYQEDPPSPVKKISNISKKLDEALSIGLDSEKNSVDQILREIDWNDEKLVNFNNIENPDHKYISEILIASGLVNHRNSNELLHSQGTLINPKLFLALEQMKTNTSNTTRFNIEDGAKNIFIANSPEKLRRKLIFDVVNDILAERKVKGKKLFEELCIEIDELQPKNKNIDIFHEDENSISLLCRDLKDRNTVWTNRGSEKPNIVLDIERSIFRDLITEVCER